VVSDNRCHNSIHAVDNLYLVQVFDMMCVKCQRSKLLVQKARNACISPTNSLQRVVARGDFKLG